MHEHDHHHHENDDHNGHDLVYDADHNDERMKAWGCNMVKLSAIYFRNI